MTRVWVLALWLSSTSEQPTNIDFYRTASECWATAEHRVTLDPYRRTDCIELPLLATTSYGVLPQPERAQAPATIPKIPAAPKAK